ncbi:MAG: hypothetical protein AB7G21_06550 [Dehalococcoidia bacterium]
MIAFPLLLLAMGAAVLQVGAVPAAFHQPLAAPVLPVALLAGWAAIRRPREAWPVPLGAAIVLGAVSEGRVGLYLLALLPALAIATFVRLRERRGEGTASRRLALAAVGGAAGTLCYVLSIAAAAGTARTLSPALPALLGGMAWTGMLAALLAAALWRVRSDRGGLFA